MSICVCGFGIAEHAMGDTVCKNFVEAKAMSEKNGEIAVTLRPDATIEQRVGDVLGGYTILLNGTTLEQQADDGDELRKLHDDYKAEIICRVGYHFKQLIDQKDRDHEALIGVLGKVVEKAEIVKTERDGCLTKNTLITCKAIDELCEALSHPLVQEYLKKEKV